MEMMMWRKQIIRSSCIRNDLLMKKIKPTIVVLVVARNVCRFHLINNLPE